MSGSVGCGKVVMANGMWVPNNLPMRGIELAEGYESLPATGESFEGTNVAIFGLGNAAFEAANSLNEYANFVHIWPTRVDPATGRANLPTSWESRYIGALRATFLAAGVIYALLGVYVIFVVKESVSAAGASTQATHR
jgi:hypothetical protein